MFIPKKKLEDKIELAKTEGRNQGLAEALKLSQCEHEFDNWKEPIETDITTSSFSQFMGSSTGAYKGLSQIRFCKKCNFAQRHVI